MVAKIKNISVNCLIVSLSILFILISRESSFTVQSIIIPIVGLFIYILIKKRKFVITKNFRPLLLMFIAYNISLGINFIRHGVNTYSILQIFYYLAIVLWFFLATQKKFTKKELNFFVNSYIYFCLGCAIYIIFCNLVYNNNTFAIINLLGHKMEKNYFGAIMSLSPVFVLYKILYGKRKILNSALLVVLFWAIFYSNSRGALLSAGGACLLLVGIFLIKNASKKVIIITICILVGGFFCLKPVVQKLPYYNRYFVNSYNDKSNNSRLSRWKLAFDAFSEQPILGYGPGILYSIDEYKHTESNRAVNPSTVAHNTFLDVLIDGGLIGIIMFLVFLWLIFKPFILKYHIYLPIIANVMINCGILGAVKTVYFWNILIFLALLGKYLTNCSEDNIFKDKKIKET